jgi:hypothetical protein
MKNRLLKCFNTMVCSARLIFETETPKGNIRETIKMTRAMERKDSLDPKDIEKDQEDLLRQLRDRQSNVETQLLSTKVDPDTKQHLEIEKRRLAGAIGEMENLNSLVFAHDRVIKFLKLQAVLNSNKYKENLKKASMESLGMIAGGKGFYDAFKEYDHIPPELKSEYEIYKMRGLKEARTNMNYQARLIPGFKFGI